MADLTTLAFINHHALDEDLILQKMKNVLIFINKYIKLTSASSSGSS